MSKAFLPIRDPIELEYGNECKELITPATRLRKELSFEKVAHIYWNL